MDLARASVAGVFWLFAMATTGGVIVGTPVLFQALTGARPAAAGDSPDRTALTTFAAAALICGGLGGLLALAFGPSNLIALVVALCLGLAGGAVSPELLAPLRSPQK